ncbi:MAG: hypothetical protein H7A05_01195 [Pseudomonadales bacterium]|nr:hypothetical protein [Pseudomonadales bacterium]MCP5343212.1 hypothetical protein [Pseudomonadales bacterium]
MKNTLPSRPRVAHLTLALLAIILLVDHAQSRPINPYQAPAPVALGSGQAPTAAHCTAF